MGLAVLFKTGFQYVALAGPKLVVYSPSWPLTQQLACPCLEFTDHGPRFPIVLPKVSTYFFRYFFFSLTLPLYSVGQNLVRKVPAFSEAACSCFFSVLLTA